MDDMKKTKYGAVAGYGPLYDKLAGYAAGDVYPFHMPGHKRNRQLMDMPPVADIDITEIDGFDNLHHACGVIKEAQQRAARVCGADRTWFLVNGSTCGLLSAIFACTNPGGRLLVARNCHKAVYNAIELNGLKPVYVHPEIHSRYGIYKAVDPSEIRRLLEKYPDIQAVIITSPTYEGVLSDIRAIAEIVHSFGLPLIVDEAHGAHLGYSPAFEASAITCGADLTIQSLHKTLPSMTQTALLHQCGRRVDSGRVTKYLAMFQSSSPSYVMMAGIDRCMGLLERDGEALFSAYAARLERLRDALEGRLKNIRLLGKNDLCTVSGSRYDASKLVFYVSGRRQTDSLAAQRERVPQGDPFPRGPQACLKMHSDMLHGGKWLYDSLLKEYHLQMEMVSAEYVLAMTSLADTDEGFLRLYEAICELDERLDGMTPLGAVSEGADPQRGDMGDVAPAGAISTGTASQMDLEAVAPAGAHKSYTACKDLAVMLASSPNVPEMTCFDAQQYTPQRVPLDACCGRISAQYLYIYPPGVPFLVPGERITDSALDLIRYYQSAGLEVLGGSDETLEELSVLPEDVSGGEGR